MALGRLRSLLAESYKRLPAARLLDKIAGWRLRPQDALALNVAHAEGVRLSHPKVDAVFPGQDTKMSVRGDPREVQHGRVQRDCCSGTRFDVDPLKSEEDLQGNTVFAG